MGTCRAWSITFATLTGTCVSTVRVRVVTARHADTMPSPSLLHTCMFHGGTALQAHWHIDSSRCCAQIVAQVTQHSVLEDRWTGSTRTAPRRFQRCARRARPKRALLATRTSLQTARRTQTRCAHRARSACFQAGRVSSSWSKIAPSSAIVCARVRPWGNASISRLAIPLAPDP